MPAMRGKMGGRNYFSILVSLAEVPRLFRFNDWEQETPELRAQRVLNFKRVPEIARYILDNEEGYLFSSITASYNCEVKFVPASEGADIGTLEMDLENLQLVINDGQHRCAGIGTAVKENPSIGKEKISVLLFPFENLERVQQMFTDLNRYAHKTSKSLDVLYDHRDNLSALTMEVSEKVDVFRGMIDKEKISIPLRSPKLLTLSTLYDANTELLGEDVGMKGSAEYNAKFQTAVAYWNAIAKLIPEWQKVKNDDLKASELRQEQLSTHTVVVRALGGLGRSVIEQYPKDWERRLAPLRKVDWRKSIGTKVNPLWDNVCITAGSVVSNRQARVKTLEVLKDLVNQGAGDREEKVLARARA